MFQETIYFCEIRRSTVRYYPFTYRGKNDVLLVCFLKIFFPLTYVAIETGRFLI